MTILIAPDKFKGVQSAREVAENIAAGFREVAPNANIELAPMADGGEGTAEVICDALNGSWHRCGSHDALGRVIEARYASVGEGGGIAIIEMSEAAGMARLGTGRCDIDAASTFGVGEMILDAAKRGPGEIIVGLGGSATNDGGFGMARALGFRFFDANDRELTGRVSELQRLSRIDRPKNILPGVIAAADVWNPLLGKNGATRVFGPQKGATPDQVETLEGALTRLSQVVARDLGVDFCESPGAGAAGGLGFGLMSFCGAKMRPGFEVVAEAVGLETRMKNADVVITGEGSLDSQTLQGKAPAEVARMARRLGKRVFAIVGRADENRQLRDLFDGVYSVADPEASDAENIMRASQLLREGARELARTLL